MSTEESYLAIQRYLTDERQPYAPGTHGNTKRKIRKAAACYIVRNGILYYQRRQKGLDEFSELEVVLQADRRNELITKAHISPGGEHLNLLQTWEIVSNKYWWRGVQKQVKDHIRKCALCQSKQEKGRSNDEDAPKLAVRQVRQKNLTSSISDEDEEEAKDDLSEEKSCGIDKREVVIVDTKGIVKQFLPKHGQTMLDKLNLQRMNNEFCDITLLIEGEEFRAHKAVLASCSEYFHQLFVEKGAVSSHEAVVDLSGFRKASFLPLLDFAYTSNLSFNFCVMAEVATLARHLLMAEVLQICESVHKKVEEQKLSVYQRGDVHTLVNVQTELAQSVAPSSSETYVVTMQSDADTEAGQSLAVLTSEIGTAESLALLAGATVDGETVTVVTHSGQAGSEESLAMVAHSGQTVDGETLTLVTHSAQDSGDCMPVVQACWSLEQPQVPDGMQTGTFLISMDPGKAGSSEIIHLAAAAPPAVQDEPQAGQPTTTAESEPPAPPPPKRRPGRPPKAKQPEPPALPTLPPEEDSNEMEVTEDEEKSEDDSIDPNKRYLRKRSMKEGGYVRLHMGFETEEEERCSSPPAKTPAKGLTRRGRPPRKNLEMELADNQLKPATDAPVVSPKEAEQPDSLVESTLPSEPEGAVEKEHACNQCGMVFLRRYSLIMHTLKHEKSRSFKCSICNKEFQYAASLRAHSARHKHQRSQRACLARTFAAEDPQGSEDQARYHVKRQFVCDICGKVLPRLYSLRIHMLNHTGVRPHSCIFCEKAFATKQSLKMHMALHDSLKKFHCTVCEKAFVTKRSLEEHMSVHTGESKYLCTMCGASFHRASGLSKHLKKHQPKPEVRAFQCSHCEKSFFEAKDLQQHMNKHLGLKPFQCQYCGKCYSWKKDWYSHVKSHSVAEPYKCNVCGKEFFEKALFRRHVKKATHGKKGRVKQNLERECEHCGRKFTQLREYRRHMNNHQGVKPFECLTCGVAWADARSLKRHVRTHTGERPYVCPLCQEAHIDARTLRKHISKFHADQLPGKIMLEKDTLQFHNQGTQVEHAVSILSSELPPELQPPEPPSTEEIETVLITEETVEAVQAVSDPATAPTLSDHSIMQVVNYVLSQQAVGKVEDPPEIIQTMEVEVAHVAEVE
ncbi:hypothetical protein DNTS_003462 [Danionella cerebrum]|uniref:Zinc finger and BTB domain-containing protein 11 n=1 Tax=Danionella cerebrum TaxID=2873325 RepID=A0A553QH85_9TELE|nr:hypothetical protein DNTS_003462 [Danionella translucida]